MIGEHAKDMKQMLMSMPQQQFAQFAHQHSQDATIFPLVYEVGKLRKAAENQQAMQAQQGPTVADKALQEITMPPQMAQQLAYAQQAPQQAPQQGPPGQNLPENTGIAAIAPASAGHFAHGGIIGFNGEERSDVDASDARKDMPYGEQVSNAFRALGGAPIEAFKHVVSAPGYGLFGGARKEPPQNASTAFAGPPMPDVSGLGATPEAIYSRVQQIPPGADHDEAMRGFNARFNAPQPGAAPAAQPGAAQPGAAQPGAPTGMGAPLSAPTAPAFMALPTAPAPIDMSQIRAQGAEQMTRQEQINAQREADAAKSTTEARADQLSRGEYGQRQMDRNEKELGGMEGKKDDALRMFLLDAGLRILTADPSRGALAAIGTGFKDAVPGYKGDLDKLETIKNRLTDSMDKIEAVRFQMKDADAKELRGFKKEERGARTEGLKALMDLQGDFGWKLSLKEVDANYSALQKQYEAMVHATSASNVANINAAASIDHARITAEGHKASAGQNHPLELVQAISKDPALLATFNAMYPHPTDRKLAIDHFSDWLKTAGIQTQNLPPAQQVAIYTAQLAALGGPKSAPRATDIPNNAQMRP